MEAWSRSVKGEISKDSMEDTFVVEDVENKDSKM